MNSNNSSENSNHKEAFFKRLTSHRAFIPVMIFIGVVLIFSFSSQFSERPPEIHSLTPPVADGGDILVISGDNFGDVRHGGEVSVAGVRPVSSSYYEWTDDRISVQIPNRAGSGMVTVTTRTGKSNSVLFTNKEDIPVVIEGPSKPGYPYIDTLTPRTGSVGDLITVKGLNFGNEKDLGTVYFSTIRSPLEEGGYSETDKDVRYIPAGEIDFDYESWSENEIKVRVPDGATSGNLLIETDKGRSNPIYFEVVEPVGTKLLTTKRGFQAQYGVIVRNVVSQGENELYLWVPKILLTPTQNNIENDNNPEPYWDYSNRVFVYHFGNMASTDVFQVTQSYWFDRYGLETKIQVPSVRTEYENKKLFEEYTRETEILPVRHEKIDKIVKNSLKWETNPYIQAQLLFTYLTETFTFSDFVSSSSILDALELERGDAYIYAVLYATLLRNAGITCRVKSGYIVYGDKKTQQHFWNEFYLENFGWVPVDCALADGARFGNFPYVDNPGAFYFGNIDNQHICTGKGMASTVQIKPDNRIVRRADIFPLQESHEEISQSIQSYRTIWQKMRIIEWW